MKALIYENELLMQFRTELRACKCFDLATALITKDGFALIEKDVVDCLERGGKGRVLFGTDMATEPDAVSRLLDLRESYENALEIRRFGSVGASIFHPKLAVFQKPGGKKSAIIASANLSARGFEENIEVSLLITDLPTIKSVIAYFEVQFEGYQSEGIDDEWLQRYTELWKERRRIEAAAERERTKALGIRPMDRLKKPTPKRIKDCAFSFTGRIPEWPRESRLYPMVRKRGGRVIERPEQIGLADCLVQGMIHGDHKETLKLQAARLRRIRIIGMKQFLGMLED